MSANILEAVRTFATPAMMTAAASAFKLDEKQASIALGAAVTSVLGRALQQVGDTATMSKIAKLAGSVPPDPMVVSIAGMLSGGIPTSPLHVLGNRLLGCLYGSGQSASVKSLATATAISPKAAAGFLTLAAPIVLAALRARLGATPTPAAIVALLNAERGLIAQAMPASLRAMYGLSTVLTAATSPTPVPSMPPAAAAPAATTAAVQAVATGTPRAVSAPVAQLQSGHASAAIVSPARENVAQPYPTTPEAAPEASQPGPAPPKVGSSVGATVAIIFALSAMAAALGYWTYFAGR